MDIGTPDREALFASSEGVKWPTDSSHSVAGFQQKAKPPNILATVAGFP
ncbi:hypothetical protein [Bacillus cereus group sp. MYBK139-2]